jgi:HAD superfamily hydrolase (TIGR01490 family)
MPDRYDAHVTHRLSIFDLDRTLTRRGTYSPFLLLACWRLAPWRLFFVPLILATMAAYKAGLISRKQLKMFMHARMLSKNVARSEIGPVIASFAAQRVRSGMNSDVVALLRAEKAAGRIVMIATAAPDYYATAIGALLGVQEVVATHSVWKDECLTPGIDGENCYGPAKKERLSDWLETQSVARANCNIRFFSDDLSDLPSFEWADERFVVHPTPSLAQYARRAGWAIPK